MDDRKCFSINDVLEVIADCDLRVWEESQASAGDRVRTRLLAKLPMMDSNTACFSFDEVYDVVNDCIVALRDRTIQLPDLQAIVEEQTASNAREMLAHLEAWKLEEENSL